MVGGLTRLSPPMSTINTKIVPGGQFSHPVYFKCMTKEEIIARKNERVTMFQLMVLI